MDSRDSVIPAQAGIQEPWGVTDPKKMDSRFRGNDNRKGNSGGNDNRKGGRDPSLGTNPPTRLCHSCVGTKRSTRLCHSRAGGNPETMGADGSQEDGFPLPRE